MTPERQAELDALANEQSDLLVQHGACTDSRSPKNEEENQYFHLKMDELMKAKCMPQ